MWLEIWIWWEKSIIFLKKMKHLVEPHEPSGSNIWRGSQILCLDTMNHPAENPAKPRKIRSGWIVCNFVAVFVVNLWKR